MNAVHRVPAAALAGAVALGMAALSACAPSEAGEDSKADGRFTVTASFYPLGYLAQQIGGDDVSVTTLTPAGAEPHELELKPRQITRLGESGLVLYLKGIAPAVDDAVTQSEAKNVVDAASLTTLEKHDTEAGHGHPAEEDDSALDGGDPHIWLDPVRFAEVAKGVGAALEKADPANAADYRKNTTALVGKLGALDTAFKQGLAHTDTRTFITTHAAFGYLAERYGLVQEAIVGIDPESEPSPARIRDLETIAQRDKVSTVFFETLASDKTARTVAADSGLKTAVLDPLEGITDKSKGRDYIEVMHSNLAALQKALGASGTS